ncbi:MAG: hypothetical protein KKD94_04660 [Nanoarchaeota archaeon]|nr:hypothetical protein [Nanoarchaeota archaeon]MBU1988742.1 hypothetical protein [Nanoarchaeota archaeon]
MGKNSHLHLTMETSLKEFLKEEAIKNGMGLSEYCRQKIRDESRLQKIERLLLELKEKLK